MNKQYLLSYEISPFQPLNLDGCLFRLTILKKSFWGLFKETITQDFVIPGPDGIKQYTEHWDTLIAEQKPL